MMISPQFLSWIPVGATKSFISLLNELPEERLFSHALVNAKHVPVVTTPALVRLTPISPICPVVMPFVPNGPPKSWSHSEVPVKTAPFACSEPRSAPTSQHNGASF